MHSIFCAKFNKYKEGDPNFYLLILSGVGVPDILDFCVVFLQSRIPLGPRTILQCPLLLTHSYFIGPDRLLAEKSHRAYFLKNV